MNEFIGKANDKSTCSTYIKYALIGWNIKIDPNNIFWTEISDKWYTMKKVNSPFVFQKSLYLEQTTSKGRHVAYKYRFSLQKGVKNQK